MTITAFNGPLSEDMQAYLDLKRSLGMKSHGIESNLGLLDAFLAHNHPRIIDLTAAVLAGWLTESEGIKPATRASRLGTVRQFCLFRRRTDPAAYVPDREKDRMLWPVRVPRYRPYIFTTDEVKRVLRTALELPPSRTLGSHRPETFFTLILLLCSTGLRLSEANGLRIGDIDWAEGTLLIRDTKFYKSRMVPVAQDVLSRLRDYQSLLHLPRGKSSLMLPLFQKRPGQGYATTSISETGMRILRSAGLKPPAGREGPRLHDLRHYPDHRIIPRPQVAGCETQP